VQLLSASRHVDPPAFRDRVHLLELGSERIHGDAATVNFRALHETTIEGSGEGDDAYTRSFEMFGPATFRRVDGSWRLEDWRSEGRTAREALRVAEGTVTVGAVTIETLAAVIWPEWFVIFARVRNGLGVPVAIRLPTPRASYRVMLHTSRMREPDAGGSMPPAWAIEEAGRAMEFRAEATSQVGWAYEAAIPLWIKRLRLEVPMSNLKGGTVKARLRVRLREFPEDALDGWGDRGAG
jgi:hypothetical protein